jgi:hypothetical protein
VVVIKLFGEVIEEDDEKCVIEVAVKEEKFCLFH